jgi:hypothetical protein
MNKILSLVIAISAVSVSTSLAGPIVLPPTNTPIDGGLKLIIGGGLVYAAKKYRDQNRK